jgi:non-heme chloroperoxidase
MTNVHAYAAILSLLPALGCAQPQPAQQPVSIASLPALVRGTGPEVVFVHGAVGDYRIWDAIVAQLVDDYRVVAVSRRYHWPQLATPSAGDYTFAHQADDLAHVLQARSGKAHLVGHSYGAGVALLVALDHPELIRSLVLIEPPFSSVVPPTENGFTSEVASRDSLVATIRTAVSAGMDERAAEQLIDWVQAGAGRFSDLPAKVQEQVHANARTIGPTYSSSSPRIACDDLRKLRVPVLVVSGDKTRHWYQMIARHTKDCIPQAEISTIRNAGHMLIAQQPLATATVLAGFFKRVQDAQPK